MASDLTQFEDKMKERVNGLDREFSTIRAGRANPKILDTVFVDYYGASTPISQMSNVSIEEARILVIHPFDSSVIKDMEKAIHNADIGVSPQNDGKVIRLVFPQLTEERRKDLAKDISGFGEDAKVTIRNIRREANDFFKKQEKEKEITEDDLRDAESDVQKLTDKYCDIIDEMVADKENEIKTV